MISAEYAAGFFDGEGSISILVTRPNKKHPTAFHRLRVQVAQRVSHRAVLDELAETFGGAVYVRKQKTAASQRWIAGADWIITRTSDAQAFLLAIEPFVIVKREQVDIALRFLAARTLSPLVRDASGHYAGRPAITPEEFALRESFRQELLAANRLGSARTTKSKIAVLDLASYQGMRSN